MLFIVIRVYNINIEKSMKNAMVFHPYQKTYNTHRETQLKKPHLLRSPRAERAFRLYIFTITLLNKFGQGKDLFR